MSFIQLQVSLNSFLRGEVWAGVGSGLSQVGSSVLYWIEGWSLET